MNWSLLLSKKQIDNTLIQLFRYVWVGGFSFVIDYLSLYVLTEFIKINYLVSAAIAFIFGLSTNYVLSTLWVFSKSRLKNKCSEFLFFSLVGIVGLGINEIIMYICCYFFSIYYMISKLISTVIVFLWNFFGRKYLIFTNSKIF